MAKFNLIFHNSNKKYLLSKHRNKAEFRYLEDPAVIFQALEPLQPQWPQQPQQPRWPQWPQQPHFIQELPEPDGWIIPGTKMTSTSVFCWMDHQKSNFLFVSDIFSVRGCWGQPMLLFWKLVANIKMSWPQAFIEHNLSMKLSILIPAKAKLLYPFRYETPCMLSYLLLLFVLDAS